MLRTIALSILMLVSVLVMLPFASSTAHGLRHNYASSQQRRVRRHSRAWWRRYRARLRMRRAAALAAHRNAPLTPLSLRKNVAEASTLGLSAIPSGWSNSVATGSGEIKFRTDSNASAPGQASLTVVARSRPTPGYLTQREQKTMLSGVAFSDLRRIVIDKMINSGGWVINDYERQVNGLRAFVVIAQTPSEGRNPERSWNFYFAEVDGKIFSLTLNTPVQYANQLTAEGEKFLASLKAKAAVTTQTVK